MTRWRHELEDGPPLPDPDWLTVHMPRALHDWLMYEAMIDLGDQRYDASVLAAIDEYAEAQLPEP